MSNIHDGQGMKTSLSYMYQKQARKKSMYLILMLIVLILIGLISLFLGSNDVGPKNFLVTCFSGLDNTLHAEPMTKIQISILKELRLPRIVCAVIVGAVLSVNGVVMQATTGNIMASPYTTGISSAAALGAAIGIIFHPFGTTELSAMIFAFVMGAIDAVVVYGFSAMLDMGAGGMILIGVALNLLFSSGNSLLQYIASDDQLAQIVHWSFGSLTGIKMPAITIMALGMGISILIFMKLGWSLNICASNGDESAMALGVNPNRLRLVCGLLVTITTAIVISFVGVIGFVGLVAPPHR